MKKTWPWRAWALGLFSLGCAARLWVACGGDGRRAAADGGLEVSDASGEPRDAGQTTPFKATVRRTSLGVPHVKADDLGGLGYGYGYVFAQDNLCILAEEILTVRGERAKYFGDVPYDLGNTSSRSNVNSDAVYRMLAPPEKAERMRSELSSELQALVRGYAAGVSRYVRELKHGKHGDRHLACRHEPWLREIDDEDLYLRYCKLALLASAATLIDGIAAARPVDGAAAPGASYTPGGLEAGLAVVAPKLMAQRRGELGSNMYAFGSEVTGGGGIQLSNPHYPWHGGERLYQVHLTVPGKMDIQGASLYGVPVVSIGFTETFAWGHTVSPAYRFTPYALTLKPGDPFTYLRDGEERQIVVNDFEIEVKEDDGRVRTRSVRLYRSEYGPMVYLGNAALNWTAERAFTIRDANAENFRMLRNYARWNMAKTLAEFKRIQAEEVAVPWVNTAAADENGDVYFADITVVPNVPDELARNCEVPILSAAVALAAPGLPLLDGARADCDWLIDPDSPQPGTFGPSQLPALERKDWVVNCNDSYWLTNPRAPLTGFAKIIGREAYEQTLRSRLCHQQVLDRLAGSDGLEGKRVTAASLKQIALRSRVFSAERFKDELTSGLCGRATLSLIRDPLEDAPLSAPVEVTITAACAALSAWDNRNDSDSRGSLVWDEFWFRVVALRASGAAVYETPFDPADPIGTPRDLNAELPELAQAFAGAVRAIENAGFAFDAPRASFSYREGAGGPADRIAIPGGFQRTGNFTVAQATRPTLREGSGYGPIDFGNSYLQVVAYGPDGLDASTLVTYGLSTDPASPHYDDYTRLYANKEWLRAAFTEAEIAADTTLTLELAE
jgi:acyl-homoserine-lactone acylase